MKTITNVLVVLGMAVVMAGCGRDQTRDVVRGERFALFEVRLLGQNPGNLKAALFSVFSMQPIAPVCSTKASS